MAALRWPWDRPDVYTVQPTPNMSVPEVCKAVQAVADTLPQLPYRVRYRGWRRWWPPARRRARRMEAVLAVRTDNPNALLRP